MKPTRRTHHGYHAPAPEPAALLGLKTVKIPPPARARMLEAVYSQADLLLQDEEERKMHPFYSLFTGKRFSTRLAAGVAIVLVMVACLTVTLVPRPRGGGFSLEPVQPALASQPGYLLAAFSSAEDEAAAKAEAEQLQQLAQELITLKQGELERFQQMLSELQAELEAKQALIAQELSGQELAAPDQAKLAELEAKLAEKAAQLQQKSARLLELAGLLSAKEQFVKQQADVVKLNLEGLDLPDGVKIKSAVEQTEDGKYQIYLTLPNVPVEVAQELKLKLDTFPGLEQVEVDGVSIVTGVDAADAPQVMRELKLAKEPGAVISKKIILLTDGQDSLPGAGDVDVKEVDGQIVVRIESNGGHGMVLDGDGTKIIKKKVVQHGAQEPADAQELNLEELDKLYQVIVTGGEGGQSFTVTVPGENGFDLLDRVSNTVDDLLDAPGAKLYKGELELGHNIERLKELRAQGYINREQDARERLQELLKQGYLTEQDVQVITKELPGGELELKIITEGDIPQDQVLKLDQLLEMDPELQEKLAQVEVFSDGMNWTVPGENTLSITLKDDNAGEGTPTFGWVNDDELGNFVLLGEEGDELRAVEVGDAKVYIGNQDAYQAELKEIRAYIAQHYPGQGAGFKATGQGGKLTVKVLLDGQVAEVLFTERAPGGAVVITNQD